MSVNRILIFIFCLYSFSAQSQIKIAILPFSNLDGSSTYNKYCYELQDSLTVAFARLDTDNKYVSIVPASDISKALNDMQVSADNPNFDADKWRALDNIKCDRVISGTFRIVAKRFLVNSYIYYPDTQLQDQEYQAKDIFKKEDKILESISSIVKQLSKAFIAE